jgi:hypothetical protein
MQKGTMSKRIALMQLTKQNEELEQFTDSNSEKVD